MLCQHSLHFRWHCQETCSARTHFFLQWHASCFHHHSVDVFPCCYAACIIGNQQVCFCSVMQDAMSALSRCCTGVKSAACASTMQSCCLVQKRKNARLQGAKTAQRAHANSNCICMHTGTCNCKGVYAKTVHGKPEGAMGRPGDCR